MRRWHEDRNLMLRRWREEIAKHERFDKNYPICYLAPIPPKPNDDVCHCYRGMGFLRKRSPHDCGNTRCGICHCDKFYGPNRRKKNRIRAIEENLAGWGIV